MMLPVLSVDRLPKAPIRDAGGDAGGAGDVEVDAAAAARCSNCTTTM